ncbi:inositol polyphosphate-5-phosphatase A-like isoform X2 [Babylonia areolata]|uniref:inositol polyphosphate-5-phosphatase A-like isoform X2 n=1 Tax=Babylonia areolata TaxID=304850 RepID=UPI003FD1228B
MDGDTTKVLLVTANVGSIFEEPTLMFQPWMQAFLQEIQLKEPGVVALHCQEVGGKNYEASMQHVNQFVKNLLACEELQKYDRARIFLDEDYTAADRFTALGNLYFIHEDIDSVLIWDFVDCKFVAVEGREVLSGNIENVPIKEKAKFPQHFFPEFKWSRKGFLRTRWSINNCIFDLVNIHLFHDASNIVAMESSPSLYCGNRKRALLHTLQRFENDQYSKVPLYIFGDFNFRLDSCSLIKALTPTAVAQQTLGKKDQVNKVVYTEEGNGKVVLTVETKSFDCHERHADLFNNMIKWLLQYDIEPKEFHDRLCEFEVAFPPSYPFTEDVKDGLSYMKTRVPSWCDRIMLSHSAKDVIASESHHKPEYSLIGRDTCMGDHKPVSLFVRMKPGKAPTPKAELSPLPGTSDIIIPSTQVKISEVDTTRYIHIRQGHSSTRVFRETSV